MGDLILGPGAASVDRLDEAAMLLFRGDLAAAAEPLQTATGIPCPGKGEIVHSDNGSMAWMAPDECLIFVPPAQAKAMAAAIRSALSGQHALCVDVSAMRAMFEIAGPGIRDILARGTPADVGPDALPVGRFRRSRIGQVQAAFWLLDRHRARILCRRSEAPYMNDWLQRAAGCAGPGYFDSGNR